MQLTDKTPFPALSVIRHRALWLSVTQGEALFRAADESLYEAKEQGRNRVFARLAETDYHPRTQSKAEQPQAGENKIVSWTLQDIDGAHEWIQVSSGFPG